MSSSSSSLLSVNLLGDAVVSVLKLYMTEAGKKISDKFTQFWNDLIFTQTINYGLLKKCDISDIILFEK